MTRSRKWCEDANSRHRLQQESMGSPEVVSLSRGGARAEALVMRLLTRKPGMPEKRGGCSGVQRPCPHTNCRWHLYLDATTDGIKLNFPNIEPSEMPAEWSCALDVADRGGATLEEIGAAINLQREAVRLVESRAIAKASAGKDPRDQ